MIASKMKMLADKAVEAKKNEEERKLYNYLMAEMEVEARSGRYEYIYEYSSFSAPYDIQKVIDMLVNDGYHAFTYYDDIPGMDYLKISWGDLQ